jgi:Spy/CpxP family protein refolding chaperone
MITNRLSRSAILIAGLAAAVMVTAVSAQRGGGGGGASNLQVGGDTGRKLSRLELMTKALALDDDQTKQFKAAFDEGQKNAAPIKLALVDAHAAIGAAIQGAKGQAEIDKAVLEYANQSAAMTSVEVKSLAAAMKSLKPEQLANEKGVDSILGMLHGIFLGKWDSVPDGKTY